MKTTTIIRLILSVVWSYLVYREAGIFTGLFVLNAFIYNEIFGFVMRKKQKQG